MSETHSAEATLRILFFGQCRELVGAGEATVRVGAPATAADVVAVACREFPALRSLSGKLLIAVNESYAKGTAPVREGDEIAIFPPVSGGEGPELAGDGWFVALTSDAIDSESVTARLLRGDAGAVVTFDGVVRNNTKGRRTRFLEYEAYAGMALKVMRQVVEETRSQWPDADRMAIVHRLGRLEVSETSVLIVVTSPHRGTAFEACRFAIDRTKQIVPIWKREYFEDGEVWVEGEIPPDLTAADVRPDAPAYD
jgi:molybdopterin synthase catalytic subunit